MLRTPDAGTFEHLLKAVDVRVDRLVRLSRFPENEPWWSRGRYRFDGPAAGEEGSFGTCYVADGVDVAFAESVIHESAVFSDGRFVVPAAEVLDRSVVTFALRGAAKHLRLADLTGSSLKALGLNNDISAGDDYAAARAWARAIHDAHPAWDGIRYVSRQHNAGAAVAVFERAHLQVADARALELRDLARLCVAFNVQLLR